MRIIYAAPVAQLEEHLKELPLSAFIASLLPSRDTAVAATALQLAEALMGKLPGIFRPQFLKEGVMHAMDQLSQPPPAPAPVAARPAAAAAGAPAAPVAAVSAAAAPNAAVSLATARSAAAALTAAAASASASMSAALAAAQAAAAKQAAAALAPVAGPTRGKRKHRCTIRDKMGCAMIQSHSTWSWFSQTQMYLNCNIKNLQEGGGCD